MNVVRFVALMALAASACSADRIERVSSSRSAIKGGVPAPGDVAVVGVTQASTSATCTGSLIAPNLVLTAQHCVAPVVSPGTCAGASFGPPASGDDFYVTTKPTFTFDANDYHQAVSVVLPPGSGFCGRDVALLVLGGMIDAAEAPPLVPRVDEAAAVGEIYSAVGYGATDDNGAGAGERRRRDGLTIACVGRCAPGYMAAIEWMGDEGICQGDSGGPALDAKGDVIGVVSRGSVGCVDPVYADVAANADWLKGEAKNAADLGGYELPAWAGGGPAPKPFGAACSTDDDCESSVCAGGFCTQVCDDATPCPGGYACDAIDAVCVPERSSGSGGGGSGGTGAGGESPEPGPTPAAGNAANEEEGGCRSAPHKPAAPIPLAALAAALLLFRSRRRRR